MQVPIIANFPSSLAGKDYAPSSFSLYFCFFPTGTHTHAHVHASFDPQEGLNMDVKQVAVKGGH